LDGLAFELALEEDLARVLVRFARDCDAFGFRPLFAFAVLELPELGRLAFLVLALV
jgi:hypothetical protein